MLTRLAGILARSPLLRAAPAAAGVIVADLLLLHATGAFGYAKPFVVAAFVICSVLAVVNVHAGLAILFLVASIDGLLKGWFGAGALSLLMKDYIMGLCLVGWVSGRSWRIKRPPEVRRVLMVMVALAVWVGAQVLNPNAESLLASLAGARAWLIWLPVFVLAYDVVTTEEQIARYTVWIVVIATLVGIYGLMQYFWGYNFLGALNEKSMERANVYSWYSASGEVESRIFGTTVSPAMFGGLMGFGVVLVIGWALWRRTAPAGFFALLAAGVMGCGLVLSGSRAPMMSAAISGVAAVAMTRSVRLFAVAAVFGVVGVFLAGEVSEHKVYERAASVWRDWDYTQERLTGRYKFGLAAALDHPLGLGLDSGVGVPYSLARTLKRRGHMLENDFARAMAELGLPGFAVYLYLIFAMLALAVRSVRATRGSPRAMLTAGLFACVMQVLIRLMVGPAFYGAPAGLLFFACLGFLGRLSVVSHDAQDSEEGDAAAAAIPAT